MPKMASLISPVTQFVNYLWSNNATQSVMNEHVYSPKVKHRPASTNKYDHLTERGYNKLCTAL